MYIDRNSLNPYCIGSRSWTYLFFYLFNLIHIVLILIVLEVGLGHDRKSCKWTVAT